MFDGYTFYTIASLLSIILIYFGIYSTKKYNISFGLQVLIALVLGIIYGFILLAVIPKEDPFISWLNLIGSAFTGLLRMIAVPLIFIMIVTAFVNMPVGSKKIRSWIIRVILFLVCAAVVGAIIGIIVTLIFGLDANAITPTEEITSKADSLVARADETPGTFVDLVKSFIPGNPFADLAGSRDTSMIGVVIFAAFIGFGGYIMQTKDPKTGRFFKEMVNSIKEVVMVAVSSIIKLTPYGVFAIIAATIYGTNFAAIVELGKFVAASYLAIIIVFALLLIPLVVLGLNPATYIKKTWETLVFAFSSRSSAATVPKTYATQSKLLGVEDGLASLSSSLGASIGQVGWAGIYPAMLAVMIASAEGTPIDFAFIVKLLIVIAITAFAVAGVGGGATNAAIIVLVAMGLPVTLAAVLISVEPVIDMARTALNVNGSITAGVFSGATTSSLNRDIYNSKSVSETD